MRKICIISLLLACVSVNITLAKVWLLPDYQRKQIYSNRINGEVKAPPHNNEGDDFSCSDYAGLLDLSEISDDITCSEYYYGPKTCCSNWICKTSSFPYTAELCHSEGKIPAGSSCTGKDGTAYYQKCECDTNIYPYILSNCEHILSGTSCSDEDGLHYQECITACEKAAREAVCITDCEYGCEETYPDCEDCCIECKTCPKRNCEAEGYVASKQSTYIYDEEDICYLSCEDSTPYYKPIGCAINYYDPDNYWCDTYCS
ncbi:MAG: hypothetical protein IJV97_00700 [Alphaproteobacteria bacterium]|nr:hypothetical protein [Alphaproteobacteria bacterium]